MLCGITLATTSSLSAQDSSAARRTKQFVLIRCPMMTPMAT